MIIKLRRYVNIKHQIQGAVLCPCLIAVITIGFLCIENVIWHFGETYPVVLAKDRYVNDEMLLNSNAVYEICNLPLTVPILRRKKNGLFLRCGAPGFEGLYRILLYEEK